MLKLPWRDTPLTKEQADDLFMLTFEDDTEDAPWMTMGDLQFWSASGFAHSLRNYARERNLGWYVASMLPINYSWPEDERTKTVSPDTFVAFVPDHSRTSFNVEEEGSFPPFVLEVVSPSSVARDQRAKRRAYDLMGVREYALFTPRLGTPSTLEGYRRDAAGAFVPWQADTEGRLWSQVLGLFLVTRGPLLQAQTPDGRLLLTPEETADELRRADAARVSADAARVSADAARVSADEARRRAEEEVARLRRELARYRGDN
jgi:Uma2 family endonuclease